MAHFAQIDENNIVQQVIVIDNENIHNSNGVEDEAVGVAFCQSIFGANTNWVQTSYNGNIRSKYAGVGDTWDGTDFIPPFVEVVEPIEVIEPVEVVEPVVEVPQE